MDRNTFPGMLPHARTYAAWPVWSNSTSAEVRFQPMSVTSGVNFTQTQRFEFPYDVVSASSPDPVEDATVLGPIKAKPLRVAAKTRPALTGPARGGCENWRSGWKNSRGAGRTKECAPRERENRQFQTAGFQAISAWR
jgi:hypothetical protein